MLLEPLLVGKFADYYQDVNMAWLWARMHKRSYRLGYFEGGFQAFVDILTHRVVERGANLRLKARIGAIEPQSEGGYCVHTEAEPINSGDQIRPPAEFFDRVLTTVSPGLLSRLVPSLPANYLAALKNLKSMGAVVVILALKHQLTEKNYWISLPKGEGLPFLALVEHTNYIDRSHYGHDHIIYLGDYLKPDHDYFSLTKEELLARFLPALTRFNPEFKPDWVRESWLFRTRYAQPVPPVNHSVNIPPLETPLPGLYWASMSQVYPWDRGTNYAVEIGRRAAKLIMRQAQSGN